MRHRKYVYLDIFDTSLPNERNNCPGKIHSSEGIVKNEQWCYLSRPISLGFTLGENGFKH